jgi:hypothetical protein
MKAAGLAEVYKLVAPRLQTGKPNVQKRSEILIFRQFEGSTLIGGKHRFGTFGGC